MAKNLKNYIIKIMVDETTPDLVLKLLLQNSDIDLVVGKALINNCSIKDVMTILSNESIELSDRINEVNNLYKEVSKSSIKKR